MRYLAAVLLLPVIVLWRQDNTLFTGYGYLDPWFYLGFFRNLVEFKRNLFPATYYGSRLSWILPGAAVHWLFPPVVANDLLHLGVHTAATLSLFLTLKWVAGARRALLGAMLFSVNPWLWTATGWDYVDGAAIAYCLLTVALLTWAALRPGRRWALAGAGMALAGLVYVNLYWVTMAWLLPLGYIAMAWAWHRTPPLRSFLALCLWFGAGCAVVTVALGAVNKFLDGHFFFYAPSVLEALAIRGDRLNQFAGPWKNGAPVPWLLFAAVAAVAAMAILASRCRSWARPGNVAAVVFSAQFLCALAWMAFTQMVGNPVLGLYYYASDLLPFTYLAIGAWFWPSVESLSRRAWALVCVAAAALFGLVWLDGVIRWLAVIPHAALVGIAAMTLSLALRRRAAGVILALAGSALLVAIGVGSRFSALEPHALRRQYEATMDARWLIESVRHGADVRFWRDRHDRATPDAIALGSTYLWPGSLLEETPAAPGADPDPPCGVELPPSTLIAVLSADGPQASRAASALAGCLEGTQVRLAPAGTGVFDRGSYRSTLDLLRVEAVPGAWVPVAPVFDSASHGVLQDAAASPAPEFPLRYWTLQPGGDSRAWLRPVPGGFRVQTHAIPGSLAALYPVLRAPVAGRYRFAMRYWRIAGAIRFGACQSDHPGQWLAYATRPFWAAPDPNLIFWVDLAAGQEFQLAIDNHNGSVRLPASFLMKGVNAVRVGNPPAASPSPAEGRRAGIPAPAYTRNSSTASTTRAWSASASPL
jgi:hypothetical protein